MREESFLFTGAVVNWPGLQPVFLCSANDLFPVKNDARDGERREFFCLYFRGLQKARENTAFF
jgi:hypothetical protein